MSAIANESIVLAFRPFSCANADIATSAICRRSHCSALKNRNVTDSISTFKPTQSCFLQLFHAHVSRNNHGAWLQTGVVTKLSLNNLPTSFYLKFYKKIVRRQAADEHQYHVNERIPHLPWYFISVHV